MIQDRVRQKLVFLDHLFGENVLFHQFDPTNTPKCYTWLESYGSSLRHGKNKKIFFPPCEASDFRGRSQTDFLHDLEARLMQIRQLCNVQILYGFEICKFCTLNNFQIDLVRILQSFQSC